jgi:hydrogenase-4 membrane subunit HyfE
VQSSTQWNPPVIAVSEVTDVVGAVIVSSILGENVQAAADKAGCRNGQDHGENGGQVKK